MRHGLNEFVGKVSDPENALGGELEGFGGGRGTWEAGAVSRRIGKRTTGVEGGSGQDNNNGNDNDDENRKGRKDGKKVGRLGRSQRKRRRRRASPKQ